MDTQGDGDVLNDLIKINQLEYEMPSDMSCSNQRRHAKHFFSNATYGSSNPNMSCTLQTGSSLVDDCWLHFKVSVVSADPAQVTLKTGTDLIQNLVIYARDGCELERVSDVNLLCRSIQPFQDSLGKEDCYNQLYRKHKTFAVNINEYSIPLSSVSGLFESSKKRLLPSILCAGLRVEITLSSSTTAFQVSTIAHNVTSYTVSDCYINCRENSLSDSVSLQINQSASQHGLEIPFKSVFTSRFDASSNFANLEVRKACSRALSLFIVPQASANLGSTILDSLSTEQDFSIASVQTRVGSIYLPNSVCTSAQEMYIYTCNCFDFPPHSSPAVSLDRFLSQGHGVVGQDLERSSVDLSGMSINNSRTIASNLQFSTTLTGGRSITAFLQYVAVVRVFLNNTVLEM